MLNGQTKEGINNKATPEKSSAQAPALLVAL
ncbi:MAG: hypothetical protein QG591_1, partial [Planctomycetota bacterium]|nr:hypothetical protein [Planctomycetota bacterium]